MKIDIIVNDFLRFSVANKIDFGFSVCNLMTENPLFVSLKPKVDDFKLLTEDLQIKKSATVNGGKDATAYMYQAEELWDDSARDLAINLEIFAKGDTAMVLAAGFNTIKSRTVSARPELSVKHGDKSGSVLLTLKKDANDKAVIWEMFTGENVAEAVWEQLDVTTRFKLIKEGLPVRSVCWFRAAHVNTDGTSDFCDPVKIVVI